MSLFFPSGQYSRPAERLLPTVVSCMQIALLLVAKAEDVESIRLNAPMMISRVTPCSMVNMTQTGEECIFVKTSLLERIKIGDTLPIAEQVRIPIFSSTDTTISRFQSSNIALHLIVRPWQPSYVIATNQSWSQTQTHFQKMSQALFFCFREVF